MMQFGQGQRPTVAVSGDTVVVFAEDNGPLQQYVGTLEVTSAGKVVVWQQPTTYVSSGATNASVAAFADGSIMEVHSLSSGTQTDAFIVATPGRLLAENFDNWQPPNGAQWLKYSGAWGNKATAPIITIGTQTIREMDPGPTGPAYKDDYLTGP
jgi:hypothetical protein